MLTLGPIIYMPVAPSQLSTFWRAKVCLLQVWIAIHVVFPWTGVNAQQVPVRMSGVGGVPCSTYKSIRTGSLFSKSKLPLQKWINMIHLWSIGMPVTTACTEAAVARKTAINVFQWLREVCCTKLIATPIRFGSPGTVVQADESLFNHKAKVCMISNTILNYITIHLTTRMVEDDMLITLCGYLD